MAKQRTFGLSNENETEEQTERKLILTRTYINLQKEMHNARTKFPDNKHLITALGEEYGELCQKLLQDAPKSEVQAEALQVAVVALRIYEEGDRAFDEKDWNAAK